MLWEFQSRTLYFFVPFQSASCSSLLFWVLAGIISFCTSSSLRWFGSRRFTLIRCFFLYDIGTEGYGWFFVDMLGSTPTPSPLWITLCKVSVSSNVNCPISNVFTYSLESTMIRGRWRSTKLILPKNTRWYSHLSINNSLTVVQILFSPICTNACVSNRAFKASRTRKSGRRPSLMLSAYNSRLSPFLQDSWNQFFWNAPCTPLLQNNGAIPS